MSHATALAHELYAKSWHSRGNERAAAICLTSAYRTYANWGASAKAAQLMRDYPALIGPVAPVSERVMTSTVMTSETHLGALDMSSVLKAAEVLAGEIDHGVLLQKLVDILIDERGGTAWRLDPRNRGRMARTGGRPG